MGKLRVLSAVACVVVLGGLLTACNKGIPVGPIEVTLPLGGGTLDPAQFVSGSKDIDFEGTVDYDLCNLPSEDEVVGLLQNVGGMDLSGLVKLTDLELVTLTLTTTAKDFSAITDIYVRYVPKPKAGQAQTPIELGNASSANGFGTSIDLAPTEDVDLLDIIRENDANPSTDCPKLEIHVAGSVPGLKDVITWEAEVVVNAYGVLGK